MRRLFEGGGYLNIVPDLPFLYFYSTVHFLSVNFPMDCNQTDSKSRITREIHAVKKKNPESFMITRAKVSAVRASGVRRLFEGGAC